MPRTLLVLVEHDVVMLANGSWHCRQCLGRSGKQRCMQESWLGSACGVDTVGRPDATHHLVDRPDGLVWCSRCGSWSGSQYRALLRVCPRAPPTALQALAKRRLQAGGSPPGVDDLTAKRRKVDQVVGSTGVHDDLFVVGLDGSDSEESGQDL